ncbi:MAG: hypothetical protein GX554_01215 [Elusimicrobia bacterium]|nr:hypothetical protein [Elusimicrobiota bacterium]
MESILTSRGRRAKEAPPPSSSPLKGEEIIGEYPHIKGEKSIGENPHIKGEESIGEYPHIKGEERKGA